MQTIEIIQNGKVVHRLYGNPEDVQNALNFCLYILPKIQDKIATC